MVASVRMNSGKRIDSGAVGVLPEGTGGGSGVEQHVRQKLSRGAIFALLYFNAMVAQCRKMRGFSGDVFHNLIFWVIFISEQLLVHFNHGGSLCSIRIDCQRWWK